jgi:hypothetical protein
MTRLWRGFKALLLVALGAGLAVGLGQCGKNTFPSHWLTIKALTAGDADEWGAMMSWSPEIMAKAESLNAALPLPAKLTGRAKFVISGQRSNTHTAPLGYEVELLLQSKEEMRREAEAAKKKGKKDSWEVKVFPRDVQVDVEFVLRDKDGFHLATLKGQQDVYDSFGFIQLGEPAMLKGTTKETVSAADANATKSIECIISFRDMSVSADDFLNAE